MATLDESVVVVTGGAGFIGSHLVSGLLKAGVARVLVLDSLRYGDPANLADSDRVEVVEHCFGSKDDAALARHLDGADVVFHLAAEKHNQSKDSPAAVMDANITGTHALFAAAAESKVRRVVFSSSLYAYGRTNGGPYVETEVPEPRTVYGISKLAGEHLLWHLAQNGLEANVLRYLFVYGPKQFAGMGYKSVIIKNFERLRAGLPPTVYGDGRQSLDYVYVDDVVEATMLAATAERTGLTLNVGSGRKTTVNELLDVMIDVSGKKAKKCSEPADWTAGSSRVGDVRRIEEQLGWRATTPLESGLARTWAWMNGNG